ncbi:hypothetical protein EYF80_031718 [Liparis tanakae]|uniref:Uncharacterized protein n=1 Tax=Liparis tanakae TaxID=230148 RepID=A0A4Z2GWZ3_9TELE|nr:hypothetical protein EYF80_031718 [Liparis tanakae]
MDSPSSSEWVISVELSQGTSRGPPPRTGGEDRGGIPDGEYSWPVRAEKAAGPPSELWLLRVNWASVCLSPGLRSRALAEPAVCRSARPSTSMSESWHRSSICSLFTFGVLGRESKLRRFRLSSAITRFLIGASSSRSLYSRFMLPLNEVKSLKGVFKLVWVLAIYEPLSLVPPGTVAVKRSHVDPNRGAVEQANAAPRSPVGLS